MPNGCGCDHSDARCEYRGRGKENTQQRGQLGFFGVLGLPKELMFAWGCGRRRLTLAMSVVQLGGVRVDCSRSRCRLHARAPVRQRQVMRPPTPPHSWGSAVSAMAAAVPRRARGGATLGGKSGAAGHVRAGYVRRGRPQRMAPPLPNASQATLGVGRECRCKVVTAALVASLPNLVDARRDLADPPPHGKFGK